MADTPIGKDATGYEILTEAMKVLLNQFPELQADETVRFEQLEDESGIAFSNNAGALVYSDREDILGTRHQECRYPFVVVYRAASSALERQKMSIAEFLDLFGKWLCMEPVTIENEEYRLGEYPKLTGGREITRITRDNAYGSEPQQNGVQDWILPVTVEYKNEY